MNLSSLDLNLLVVLDALLREGSVSRAANRVGLSQPAVSHSLRRLRAVLGDPLLVRSGQRMELTPRAEALREPLEAALAKVQALFAEDGFDPRASRRLFVAMMPDTVTSVILPGLVSRLQAEAPHARLKLTPFRSPAMVTPDVARHLDLVVSYDGHDFPNFHRERLYADYDALAVRPDHPDRARLSTLDGFLAARHVAVIGRGSSVDPMDAWLEGEGIRRDVVLTTPTYLQALQVAARTDLVAFVSSRLIWAVGEGLGVVQVEPPVDTSYDEQFLSYPTRRAADPGSRWFRGKVIEAARELGPPRGI